MNGIDKIIARMEADTQAECADIAAQAAAEAEAILARYRAEADKLLREGEARCKVLEHEQVTPGGASNTSGRWSAWRAAAVWPAASGYWRRSSGCWTRPSPAPPTRC